MKVEITQEVKIEIKSKKKKISKIYIAIHLDKPRCFWKKQLQTFFNETQKKQKITFRVYFLSFIQPQCEERKTNNKPALPNKLLFLLKDRSQGFTIDYLF